jgi:hypothetical protein
MGRNAKRLGSERITGETVRNSSAGGARTPNLLVNPAGGGINAVVQSPRLLTVHFVFQAYFGKLPMTLRWVA